MSTFTLSVRRRDLAWAVALVVLLTGIWVAKSDIADATPPPGTGIALVYVAVGTNFPDALGVGPGAGADSAPIIILPKAPPIPAASSAELVRLDPRSLIIVGGTGVISAATETALGVLLPNTTISRIAGANRYDTNAAFSAATFPIEGWASIPAGAFTTANPATDNLIIGPGYGDTYAYNTTDGNLYAPIQLPHGAEILEVKASVYDADGSADVIVYLQQIIDSGGGGPFWEAHSGSVFSLGPTIVSDTTNSNPGTEIVDNETRAYFVHVTGANSGTTYVRSVMVRYRLGASTG